MSKCDDVPVATAVVMAIGGPSDAEAMASSCCDDNTVPKGADQFWGDI